MAAPQTVERTYTFNFPPALVWHFVRDFFGLKRIFPELVTECGLHGGDTEPTVGSTRMIQYADGSVFHEKLEVRDDIKHVLSYGTTESSPTQVGDNYKASYFVGPVSKTGHSVVRYRSAFNGTSEEVNSATLFCELVMQAFEDRLEKAVADKETPPKVGATELKDDEVGPRFQTTGAIIPFPIDKVWDVATRYSALHKFAPAFFENCESANGKPDSEVGAVRKITGKDGSVVLEELTKFDAASHSFEYIHTADSPLRHDGYCATWELSALNDGKETYVHGHARWNSPAAVVSFIEKLFGDIMDGIEAVVKEEAA